MVWPYSSHFNGLSKSDQNHFRESLQSLKPSSITDEKFESFGPAYDGLVRRKALQFGRSKVTRVTALGHPSGIKQVLKRSIPKRLGW